MLNNPVEDVVIPDELQKRTDVARGRLTIMEQEYTRVGLLVKDLESTIRSLLEKQVQIQAENDALEARKVSLSEEVGVLDGDVSARRSELETLKKGKISVEDYIKQTKAEVASLGEEKKALIKEITDKKEAHNVFLRESEAKNLAKNKEADSILASLQTKKAKLEKALAEL